MDTTRFCVVGVRYKEADDYHLYFTNLPSEELLPEDIVTMYRCQWEVELLFRELKTLYELDGFNTSNLDAVEILRYAAPSLTRRVPPLFIVTAVGTPDQGYSKDPQASTDPARDTRYRYITKGLGLTKDRCSSE